MKKVLFMLIDMNIGGTEKSLLNILSELPKENAISKGSVGNIKESAVNRKIPTSLQRDVYKQIVRKFLLCTI